MSVKNKLLTANRTFSYFSKHYFYRDYIINFSIFAIITITAATIINNIVVFITSVKTNCTYSFIN